MAAASCRLHLRIPGAQSLKEKRSVVRAITGRVRSRFNVAIGEVDRQDFHREAVLDMAAIGLDGGSAEALLRRVATLIEQEFPVEVLEATFEVW